MKNDPKYKKVGQNVVTLLVARTSSNKFSRTGNFKKTIGDSVSEWTLLVALPFNPDGNEQWIASNKFGEFSLCVINEKEDGIDEIIPIDDIGHFLADVKPYLGYSRQKMPKIFTIEMFESIGKEYGASIVYENKHGIGVAEWNSEKEDSRVPICYGRILEMVPNPNEVIAQKNCIRIANFKKNED